MEPDRLLGVELRHLLALQAIAEHGSFGRAAQALGYTQSAISQQIAALERAVGEKLIERPGGPRPVSLTEAGRAAAPPRGGDRRAHEGGAGRPRRVRRGRGRPASRRHLPERQRASPPRARPPLQGAVPEGGVQLSESAIDDELEARLERGEVDLSFVMLPMNEAPLEAAQLLVDPVRADRPRRLAARRPREAAVAARDREAAADRLPAVPEHEAVETAIRRAGAEPRIVFRSDDNGTVQGLVGAGVGVALVPRLTLQPTDGSVETIDLGRSAAAAAHRDRVAPRPLPHARRARVRRDGADALRRRRARARRVA